MAKKMQRIVENGEKDSQKTRKRSAAYFERGIRTASDVVGMTFAVCDDMINARLGTGVGNSVCANVRNVIKIEELRHKYGTVQANGTKTLALT